MVYLLSSNYFIIIEFDLGYLVKLFNCYSFILIINFLIQLDSQIALSFN